MVIIRRIESRGLSHYSYFVGDGNEGVVIDPRRDCDPYLEIAYGKGYRISHVVETHRNEDYVVGSLQLACMTGAEVWHADSQWDYHYGNPVLDEQEWEIGGLKLRAIFTPGHTPGSMSYLLYDPHGNPWMLFTGDALFAGDVGRVDLLGPDKMGEMAEKLYDTLFNKILSLGDGIIVCPAHGSGSVCGSAIAERTWTTIGLEKTSNPALQCKDKTEFVSSVSRQMEMPPYFKMMEKLNLNPQLEGLPLPQPLKPHEFEERAKEAIVLDTRNEVEFGGAHISNSLSLWLEGLPAYAGWFLPYGTPILLVTGKKEDALDAVRYLTRIGFDSIDGYLSGGMHGRHMAGKKSDSIDMILVQDLCRRLDDGEPTWILDVRSERELEEVGYIPGAHHIHITQLPQRMEEVPKDRRVFIFCGSSLRSMTAASILKRNGWENLTVVLGGVAGWNSITCPIKKSG